jgi:hypothetical protein
MFSLCRPRILACFLLLSLGLLGRPAFAQVDLAGQWAGKMHEDFPERLGGPEIGDYTGMPINDQARMRADAWDAQKWEMVEHECQPHPADYAPRGPADMRIRSEIDPFTQEVVDVARHAAFHAYPEGDLHGWAASPLRERAAHLAGILYRRVGRGHAEGDRPII